MDQRFGSPIINPGRRLFHIPGLELPRAPGQHYPMGFAFSALTLGLLGFFATKGALAFVLAPFAVVLNVIFVSLFASHVARCKAARFTPSHEREVRGNVAFLAPILAIGYTVAYIAFNIAGGLFSLFPWVVSGIALCVRWGEIKEGIHHWFCYEHYQFPGTLLHVAGLKLVRVLIFYTLCVLCFAGLMFIPLPLCTLAFVVLCTCPSDDGVLSRWQATHLRMQESDMEEVRKAQLLGWLLDGTPVMVPIKPGRAHWAIYGTTGDGKTSLIICPMIEATRNLEDCSVLVIDMKSDDNSVHAACIATGKPVSLITNKKGNYSRVFHWFDQDYFKLANDAERGGDMTAGLNMKYEQVYGQTWFQEVLDLLARRSQKGGKCRTPQELTPRMEVLLKDKSIPPEIRRNAAHIYAVMDRLSYSPILNDTSEPSFQLSALFKTPQVLHCAFANTGDSTPGDIGRIILSGIVKAAAMVPRDKRCQLIIFIDELAAMAAKSLEILFQQCRSLGILVVLSSHSRDDLESRKLKLGGVITRNLAVSIDFSYRTGDDIKEAQAVGGTVIDHTVSSKQLFKRWYHGPGEKIYPESAVAFPARYTTFGWRSMSLGTEETSTEYLAERLDQNTLLSVSSTKKAAVVTLHTEDELNDYGGLPLYVSLDHHISEAEHKARAIRPIPRGEHTILIRTERPDEPEAPASVPITPPPPPEPIETVEVKKGRRKKGA